MTETRRMLPPVWTLCMTSLLLVFGPLLFSQARQLPPEVVRYADIVLHNGQVLTIDRDKPPFTVAKAVAVRDGRILAVGGDAQVTGLAGPNTLKVDLAGKAVIPGVVDTHSHPQDYVMMHREWARDVTAAYLKVLREHRIRTGNITHWETKEATLADVKKVGEGALPGEWVFIPMGINEISKKRLDDITRYDLDKVVPDNPLFVRSGYGLWGLVNTKMMEVVRERYGEKLLPGFVKDQQGVPTGQLVGAAGEVIDLELLPDRPPEVMAPFLKKELEEWVANGVTTMSSRFKGSIISALTMLDRKGELPLRLAYSHEIGRANPFMERDLKRWGNLEGHGTDRMWLIGISVGNPDGYGPSLPVETANDLVWVGEISCTSPPKNEILSNDLYPQGMCIWELPGDPGRDAPIIANRYGYRVTGVHNFGDKGSLIMLDSYDRATKESSILGRRFALDHGMMVSPEVIKQSAKLGIMWSLQPTMFYRRYAAGVSRVYGEEFAHRWLLPTKSLIDAGVKVAYGADTHNDPERHPMFGLQLLVTRKVKDGRVFGNREKVDRAAALIMMTRWGAEYVMREKDLGSIEAGKLADLVVLDKNPLDRTIPDEELSDIKVVATIIGGKVAYGSLAAKQ